MLVRFVIVFILSFLHYTNAYRRLINGEDVKTNKRYMVYLLQAQPSVRNYDTWMCGGAILTSWLVLTSAACVEDVQNVYAVAGTDTYVRAREMKTNACTEARRRKVVYTYVPIVYDLEYDKVAKWSYNDIALVKVEKPFPLNGKEWMECSYSPSFIPINLDPEYETPGTDAIVLGWGHTKKWRWKNNTMDYNQRKLQYVSVSILNKEECKKSFQTPDMGKQIDEYMICSHHAGNIDETGKLISTRKHYRHSNYREINRTQTDTNKLEVTDVGYQKVLADSEKFRKFSLDNNQRYVSGETENLSRKNGICQNDHGGPLVAWINGTERVIGVASVFRVDAASNCIGPFLYTSTSRNRHFIECILKDLIKTDVTALRRTTVRCDQPANGHRFVVQRRYVEWTIDNANSLLNNGDVYMRPQIPMSHYGGK